MTSVNRWIISLEFDGRHYYGWQSQSGLPTVQARLEAVLSKIANQDVISYAAGRTDKGVHAHSLIVHFDTTTKRESKVWQTALNALLPHDIRCRWIALAPQGFHARYSALARTYEYRICLNPIYQSTRERHYSWWHPKQIDYELLKNALAVIKGTHDFRGYRGRDCQAKTTIKTIEDISFVAEGDIIKVTIRGNAFLHHMVRNIIGAVFLVANGKKHIEWLKGTLSVTTRHPEIPMAPAHGLSFIAAHYKQKLPLSDVT